MTESVDERILEVTEPRWDGHARDHGSHDKLHMLEHAHEQELSRHAEKRLEERNEAHAREHAMADEAIDKALAESDKNAALHAEAHAREHQAHEQRHEDARMAVGKADIALDKRLESLNGVYGQMREQARSFASAEALTTARDEMSRRFEESRRERDTLYEGLRLRVESIEKGDAKGEGKSLGQGATVAVIVGAISLVGTILGILIVLSNVLAP